MSEIKITPEAKEVYDTVCRVFDKKNWSYEKKEELLFTSLRIKGDDMPVTVNFVVDAEREALCVRSPLPFKIKEEKIPEFTFALAAISNTLFNGWYVYDIAEGTLTFRAVTSFMDSTVSERMVDYLLNITYSTVNKHNDLFLSLNDGMITVEQFFEALQQ